MTKAEYIKELVREGEYSPCMEKWTREQLRKYLEEYREAKTLTYDELIKKIQERSARK